MKHQSGSPGDQFSLFKYLPGAASRKDHVNLKTEFVHVVFIPYLQSVIGLNPIFTTM